MTKPSLGEFRRPPIDLKEVHSLKIGLNEAIHVKSMYWTKEKNANVPWASPKRFGMILEPRNKMSLEVGIYRSIYIDVATNRHETVM